MKVIQVVPTIGNESDGVGISVRGISAGLSMGGVEVTLCCSDDVPNALRTPAYPIVNYPRKRFLIPALGCSPAMRKGLVKACQTADIIHTNGLWMMPSIYPEWAIRGTTCKLVVQPHGTLSRWAMRRSWWKKWILWRLWQKRVLDKAALFVATCEKEYKEIRALGYKQPIAIVPIGMDVPTGKNSINRSDASRLRQIVFFGRIHKVKAVDHLVKAWGILHADLPDWELVIAGPDCGAKSELEKIIAEQQIPRVRFMGEINGQAKYDFLTEADISVLPSHTENFGVTVAESLACGTPVIASQGTPWEGLEKEQCGKWIPIGVKPLVEALRELTSLTDEERIVMGENGRVWMQRDFSWDGIGAKMKAAYAWLLEQGEKPDFVRVD